MNLDKAEQDFLSDLLHDTHGVWEWPQFIKLHCPHVPDTEVPGIARARLLAWIEEGRVSLAAQPVHPTDIKTREELISYLASADLTGDYLPGAPSIDLK